MNPILLKVHVEHLPIHGRLYNYRWHCRVCGANGRRWTFRWHWAKELGQYHYMRNHGEKS